jgi:hypothetical protein
LPEWSIHYLVYQAFSGRKWLFLLNFETIFSFAVCWQLSLHFF